jgi:hypothetical protein
MLVTGCGGGGGNNPVPTPTPAKTFNISMADISISTGVEEKTYRTAEKYYRPIIKDITAPYIYAVDLKSQIITSTVQWSLADSTLGTLSDDGLTADCMFNPSGTKLGKAAIKATLADGSSDTAELIVCPAYKNESLWSGQGFVFDETKWMSTAIIGEGAKQTNVNQSDIYCPQVGVKTLGFKPRPLG